ncbi:MAG: hypothetical protein ACI4VH_03715 [Clostridia bacterium]
MYNNESFDDYIRSILGYPNMNNMYMNNISEDHNMSYSINNNEDLEDCYPEIYRIVYPMISQRCSRITEPVTREMVENMTDEIYSAIEVNNEINLNINLQNEITNNRNEVRTSSKEVSNEQPKKDNRREDRQFGNRNLRDLIQILIIRELLRRHRRPMPGRPPFPGGRPPFPGRPGMGRPPMMPREYNNMDIYEQY